MNKHITLLAAFAFGSTMLSAQTPFGPVSNVRDARALHHCRMLSRLAGTPATAKPTATLQRLIGASAYYGSGAALNLTDSQSFRYSLERGSAYDYDGLQFPSYYYPSALPQPPVIAFDTMLMYDVSTMLPQDTGVQTFNAAGQLTSYRYSQNSAAQYTYDAQGRPTSYVEQQFNGASSQWVNSYRDDFGYDGQGRMISDTSKEWNGSSWDRSYLDVFSYNVNNQPVTDMGYQWSGSAWTPDFKADVVYASNNKFSRIVGQQYTGTSYENIFKDTIGYTNSIKTFEEFYEWDGNGWSISSGERKHLNGAGLPDSSVNFFYNQTTSTWDTLRYSLAYNSYGNPVWRQTTSTLFPGRQQEYYYYQLYTTSGIAQIPATRAITVFPNPAATALHLTAPAAGRYECRIINGLGQVMLRTSGSATAGEPLSLPVQQLAPERYYFLMEDAKGGRYSAPFVKQ